MKSLSFLSIILLLFLGSAAETHPGKHYTEKNLYITWHLITNNYNRKAVILSSLTLQNNGKETFPNAGWTLYFNYNREILENGITGEAIIEHVNGDIYQLKPGPKFKGIKAGQSNIITYVSEGELLNYTSAPSGFYIVWDQNPEKGESITHFKIDPIIDTTVSFVTPESTYYKNLSIQDIPESKLIKIFPTPVTYREMNGEFVLDADVHITSDPKFKKEADFLAEEIKVLIGQNPIINTETKSGKTIILKNMLMADGAYTLNVMPDKIEIAAATASGIFYGIQSLRTLMPPGSWSGVSSSVKIPAVSVADAPRFEYRSLMLDVARNFQPKQQILKILDLMALYKLNVLHLHFSDDEGWRIQIPSLPELTDIGSRRGHTLDSKKFLPASYGAGPEPGHLPGSGYYTKDDFIGILKYANDRHIQVIPEIESPGHSRAAIKAMDVRYEKFMLQGNKVEAERYLLRDIHDQSKYSSAQLWTDNVMCVALPSTYSFLEKVIDELISMYKEAKAPLTTIHLGGDEVPEGAWEHSPVCRELINTDTTLSTTNDLWYYYFGRVNRILKSRNLFLSGWEEAAMRKTTLDGTKHFIPNPDFVNEGFRVNVWNNVIGWGSEDLPYRLANAGYKVVLSCVSNQYFDLAYEKSPEEPGYYWGGFQDVDKPFYFIPFDYYKNTKEDTDGKPVSESLLRGKDRLTDYGKSNIAGVQGLLWAENVRSTAMQEYLLLPKLLGLAERAWSKDPDWATEKNNDKSQQMYNEAWSVFTNISGKRELPRLDYFQNGYNYRIPTPGAIVQNGTVFSNFQFPGFVLRYTTDGTEPDLNSKIYSGPITEKSIIKLSAFSAKGRKGRSITMHNE